MEELLKDIDKLREIAKEVGQNVNNKGTLYYAVLDFTNKYGTHSTGDYFTNSNKED